MSDYSAFQKDRKQGRYMKTGMRHIILALLGLGLMAGCGTEEAKKPVAEAVLSVTSKEIVKDGKTSDGRAIQVLELNSSNGNQNLLLVIGKLETTDFSRPQGPRVNGTVVRFNPTKVTGQVYVFFPVGGGVTMPLTGVSAAAARPKCTAAIVSFAELDKLLAGMIQ